MKKYFFWYFLVVYYLIFLIYHLEFPHTLPNLSIGAIIVKSLALWIIPLILVSFLSLIVLYKNTIKILGFSFLVFLGVVIYESFVYWLFFMRLDKIISVVEIIFLVVLFSSLVRFILNVSISVLWKKIIILMPLVISLLIFVVIIVRSETATIDSCNQADNASNSKNFCIQSFAIKNSNLDTCMFLPREHSFGAGTIPDCMHKVLSNLYSENKLTLEYCDLLKNEDAKSVCFNRLAILEGNEKYCIYVKDWYENPDVLLYLAPFGGSRGTNMLSKESCYLNIAIKEKKSNLCTFVKEEFQRRGCEIDSK